MKKLFTYILAVIGVISILAGAFILLFLLMPDTISAPKNDSENKVETTIVSPGGLHTVTRFTRMGGGAAGSCYQIISVNKLDDPFSLAAESESALSGMHQVLRVSCGTKVKLQWFSDTELLVDCAASDSFGFLSIYYMRDRDKAGAVQINYSLASKSGDDEL
jgi:hypothetical protein